MIWPSQSRQFLAAGAETAKEIIAAQLRRQGFACQTPKTAKRDRQRSKPDEAAWILTCENATYRVILVPDMAARVEKLN